MAVQEEPKEPHVSSVLPWIILHRIIWQEEDTFHSLCHQQQLQNPADEGGREWVWVGVGPDSLIQVLNGLRAQSTGFCAALRSNRSSFRALIVQ